MEEEKWYVLKTHKGREYAGADLIRRTAPGTLCTMCSIPKKIKPFRHGGVYYPTEDVMLPGYLFIRSGYPRKLQKELEKSREFPQFLIFGKDTYGEDELIPVSDQDLLFLKQVCGEFLQSAMGITDVTVGEDKRINRANGVLEHYVNQVVKLNLHKRIAVAKIPLFNRTQEIFFGIRLEHDLYESL